MKSNKSTDLAYSVIKDFEPLKFDIGSPEERFQKVALSAAKELLDCLEKEKINNNIKIIDEASKFLCKYLEQYYPGISTIKYTDMGQDVTFESKMKIKIAIELSATGLVK